MKKYILLIVICILSVYCKKKPALGEITIPQACSIRVDFKNKVIEQDLVVIRGFLKGSKFDEKGKCLQVVTDEDIIGEGSSVESIFILSDDVVKEDFLRQKEEGLQIFLKKLNIDGYSIALYIKGENDVLRQINCD